MPYRDCLIYSNGGATIVMATQTKQHTYNFKVMPSKIHIILGQIIVSKMFIVAYFKYYTLQNNHHSLTLNLHHHWSSRR